MLSLQCTIHLNFKNAQRYVIAKSDVCILRKLQKAYIAAESLLDRQRADREGAFKDLRNKLNYECKQIFS